MTTVWGCPEATPSIPCSVVLEQQLGTPDRAHSERGAALRCFSCCPPVMGWDGAQPGQPTPYMAKGRSRSAWQRARGCVGPGFNRRTWAKGRARRERILSCSMLKEDAMKQTMGSGPDAGFIV